VLKDVSRTTDVGSPNNFTREGMSRDTETDCAPYLKQTTLKLINVTWDHIMKR